MRRMGCVDDDGTSDTMKNDSFKIQSKDILNLFRGHSDASAYLKPEDFPDILL